MSEPKINQESERDLTSLALRAAVELDSMLNRKETSDQFRKAFARRLQTDVHEESSNVVKIQFSPTTSRMVARTLKSLDPDTRTDSVGLRHLVNIFADGLQKLDSDSDQTIIKTYKDYCLKLHRKLLAESRHAWMERKAQVRHV